MPLSASLTEILLRRGALTSEQVGHLSQGTPRSARELHHTLIEDGLLTETDLAEALAEQAGLPYRSLKDYRVDFNAYPTIPVDWMRGHGFVPLEERDGVLTIADRKSVV